MKKQLLFFLVFFTIANVVINAQDLNFDENIRTLIEGGAKSDTISAIQSTQTNNHIRTNTSNRLSQRNAPLKMSEEALYWSRYAAYTRNEFGPNVTFQDTIIVNPLFLPPVFKPGNVVPKQEITFHLPVACFTEKSWEKPFYKPVKIFQKEEIQLYVQNRAYRHIQHTMPFIFRYSADHLPSETIYFIENTEEIKIPVESRNMDVTEYTAPVKFIPDRKYWISSFESSLKFSENSTSDNWHSGPIKTTILNIFTRNIVKYNYAKDRIKLDNSLELRLNLHNAPNDTLRQYKVSDDFLRLHSNFGVKAFQKWYYTLDGEFKTQLFANYQENTVIKRASLLSPYTFNFGIGMKYDHTKQYKRIDRSLVLSVNLAPVAYTYMSAISDSIDWGRHGFPKDEQTGMYKKYLSIFGSTIDFQMTLKPNRDVTWKSRFKYFTSYDRVITEFENSLDFAISRFFSTLLYLNLRYDDGVTKSEEKSSYLQWNQLISFGFSYQW